MPSVYESEKSQIRRGFHSQSTFSFSSILLISASPAFPSFLSSFLAALRALSRIFCSASLKGGACSVDCEC